MSHLKQFAFAIENFTNQQVSHVSIDTHPFQLPAELLGVVNQNGQVKIHGIVDVNQPKTVEEFLVVGTGGTIPPELLERLYRVGTVLLSDNRYGYHVYHLGERRGIPTTGSDLGITPKFKLSLNLEDACNTEDDEVVELIEHLKAFCAKHSGLVRLHLEQSEEGIIELFGFNDEFSHDQEFLNLLGYLYKAESVSNVNVSKNV
jgi:hypothetical protein